MKVYWEKDGDPYDEVADIIFEKYKDYGCCFDFVVRLKVKYNSEKEYREFNELLYDNGDCYSGHRLCWQNDWYEGEQEVELLGCVPVDELEYPYNKRWLL